MIRASRIAALLVALALAGCGVATDLSQYNTRYDVLAQRKSALGRPSQDIAYLKNAEDIEAGFRVLAADATKASGAATEPATRIVALRLAAVAAWQANDDATYTTAQSAGATACRQIPKGSVGAPRDCAILAYLPVLRAYEQDVNTARAIAERQARNDPTVIAEAAALVGKIRVLRDENMVSLPDIVNGRGVYDGVSPTTVDYFRKVALATACFAEAVLRNSAGMRPDSPEKTAMVDAARQLVRSFSTLLFNARLLTADDPNWYAQPGACPKNP
jgi:hypothetical protein